MLRLCDAPGTSRFVTAAGESFNTVSLQDITPSGADVVDCGRQVVGVSGGRAPRSSELLAQLRRRAQQAANAGDDSSEEVRECFQLLRQDCRTYCSGLLGMVLPDDLATCRLVAAIKSQRIILQQPDRPSAEQYSGGDVCRKGQFVNLALSPSGCEALGLADRESLSGR